MSNCICGHKREAHVPEAWGGGCMGDGCACPCTQLRSEATPKEPAATPSAALLSREELEGITQQLASWKRMTWGHYNVASVLAACDRLIATARAGIEAREECDRLAMKLDAMTAARNDYHDALRVVQDNISQAGAKLAGARENAERRDASR